MGLLTVLEQHIAVRDGVQKHSSSQVENFYPEEIDHHLNKAQDVFMDSLTSESFSNPIIRNEYFQNILVRNYVMNGIIPTNADSFYEENMVYGILPANYLYHINSRALLTDICGLETPPSPVSNSFNTLRIEFPISTKASGPYYRSTTLKIGPDIYTSKATVGYSSSDEYFEVVSELLNLVNSDKKYNLYWEQFNGVQYPGKFIVTNGTETINGLPYQNPNTVLTTFHNEPAVQDRQIFGVYIDDTQSSYDASETSVWVPTILKELDDIYLNNTNSFFLSKKSNPYGNIAEDKLYIHLPEMSIIPTLRIDYVRRPARISLALNSSCELSGNATRRIVDLAVQRMKLITENPTVQAFQQEQQLRENH